MPYAEYWIPPDIVLIHRGIPVYRVYREGDYDRPLDYWYTLNPDDTEGDNDAFDIREFPIDGLDPTQPATHPVILRRLIEYPEWLAEWLPDTDGPRDPLYRLQCPHCGADNPGFQVIAATFQTGPFLTTNGVRFEPYDTPATVTVRCGACHATCEAAALQLPDSAAEQGQPT